MKKLHDWFKANRREFPWRKNPDPYRVWISEVMLQQTRASVVIPYFERWMTLFPNVTALAKAPLEKVIKAWEGLGYYSRARHLHAGAQQIVEQFQGQIPSTKEELESIKGLGPYTVGAILNFGFRKRAAAVDGNVTRVLSRYFSIEENVCKQAVKKKISSAAESLLDAEEPWITSEALIELGATICTPKPRCDNCPLREECQGQDKAELLPIKNEEQGTTHLQRTVLLITAENKVLVRKGEKGKVMADLYEFPYFEMGKERWTQKQVLFAAQKELGLTIEIVKKLPPVTHTFTRYKASLYPLLCTALVGKEVGGYEWMARSLLSELPFSSGHRRILQYEHSSS